MALQCAKIPNYDTRRCCQTCHDLQDDTIFQVMIDLQFVDVCCEAYRYAKKNRRITSRMPHARKPQPVEPRVENEGEEVSPELPEGQVGAYIGKWDPKIQVRIRPEYPDDDPRLEQDNDTVS